LALRGPCREDQTLRKPWKHDTGTEKRAILRRHRVDRVAVAARCEAHPLPPSLFYDGQKKRFEHGAVAFEGGRRKPAKAQAAEARRIAAPEAKRQTRNDVRAERMEW